MTDKTPYTPTVVEREDIFQTILDGVRAGSIANPVQTANDLIQCLTVLNQSSDPSGSTNTQRQDLP